MDELEKLLKWFNDNANIIRFTPETYSDDRTIHDITDWLAVLSFEIKKDYPFYSERLFTLKNNLFMKNNFVNVANFGRISEILIFLKHTYGQKDQEMWACVHHAFHGRIKDKFLQGNYADAIFSASKILMNRLIDIYKKMEPDGPDIDGSKLVENLFSEKNPKIIFSDLNTQTGYNIQRGNSYLFKGWVYRIRNVNAHEELDDISCDEGVQDLLLISKLMKVLDDWDAASQASRSDNK